MTRRTAFRWAAPLAAALPLLAAPAVFSQDTVAAPAPTVLRRPAASPLLPPDHWAVRAAGRAHALGLASDYLPAQEAVPRHVVWGVLVRSAEAGEGAYGALAAGWVDRFAEEFSEYAPPGRGHDLVSASAAVSGGYREAEGRLAPAIGYLSSRQPPLPIDDVHALYAGGAAAISAGRALAASAEVRARSGELALVRWQASAGWAGWMLGVGREEVRYGPGRGGGVVLSPAAAFPRIELQTTTPFVLPSVLKWLGPVSTHVFVTGLADDARHPTEPLFWGMRLAVRPHPRLTIGGNRAAIFGGEGRPVTLRNVAGMLVGVVHSNFENQVISGDVRWRLPTEGVLPLTAYLEWGADDAAGGAHEMPGRVLGLQSPALPGLPGVALGLEYAGVATACCGHGAWYFNNTFRGNWAIGDQALAHPLGGEGWEASAYASVDAGGSRLRADLRGFVRERGDRSYERFRGGTLFGPERTGRSRGGVATGALRVGPRTDLRVSAAAEVGNGWREHDVALDVAVFF